MFGIKLLVVWLRGVIGGNGGVAAKSVADAPSTPRFEQPAVLPQAVVPAFAPAVAGYERRIIPQDFALPARLASAARLNPPKGRLPVTTRRIDAALPQVPAARIGAKKVRNSSGPRVLAHKPALRSAEIIMFPRSNHVAADATPADIAAAA